MIDLLQAIPIGDWLILSGLVLIWGFAVSSVLWYVIYSANLAAMNSHVEDMEEDEECCAEEGHCECEESEEEKEGWDAMKELVDKMGGKEIPAHGISATISRDTCGYTPPKEEEQG